MADVDRSDEPLTPNQTRLIAALLTTDTLTAAAKQAGISERTARRWLVQDAFQLEYRRAQREVYDQAIAALIRLMHQAVAVLSRSMNASMPPAIQLRAAQLVLDQASGAYKLTDLEVRLADLEKALHDQAAAAAPRPHVSTNGRRPYHDG